MHHELNLFSFVTFSGDNTDEMTQKKRKTDHSDSMEAFPKKTTFLPQSKGMILYSFASLWFRVFYLLNDTVLCLYFPILVQMFECVILGYEGAKRKNSLTPSERSSRNCQGNGDDRKSPCSTREIPVPSRPDMMSPTSGRTTRRDRETPSRSISRDHELPGWSDTSPSRDGGNSGRSPIHLQRYETRSPIFENTPASRLPSPSDSVFSRPTRY